MLRLYFSILSSHENTNNFSNVCVIMKLLLTYSKSKLTTENVDCSYAFNNIYFKGISKFIDYYKLIS